MSGILQDLAERFNLTVDKTQAWGSVDGFWFQVELSSVLLKIRTAVSLMDEAAVNTAVNGLLRLKRENKNANYARHGGEVLFSMKKPAGASASDEAAAVLLQLADLFRQAGATPACYKCGAPSPGGFALVNGSAIKLCTVCQADLKGSFEEQAVQAKAHHKVQSKAYFGAVVGALVGSVFWIWVGCLGWMAWFCGSFISACSVIGFRMMKGRVTYASFFRIFLVCLIVMVLSQYAVTDIELCRQLTSQGIHFSYFQVVLKTFVIPFEYHWTDHFLAYLGFGFLFIAAGFASLMRVTKIHSKVKVGKFEHI